MEKFQTTIFLVRHGRPIPRDPEHRHDPVFDHPRKLTEEGTRQAKKDGKYLGDFPITAIYSSPVERCKQTAQLIREAGNLKKEVAYDKGLTEVYPSEFDEASGRGDHFLKKAVSRHSGEDIICVTHRFVIGSILARFFGKSDWSEVPCEMGDIYQAVFAGDILVSASRLQPWKI